VQVGDMIAGVDSNVVEPMERYGVVTAGCHICMGLSTSFFSTWER
jgi:hypothetical protein